MFESEVRQPFFEAEGAMGGGGGESATSSSDVPGTPGWGLPSDANQAAENPLFQQQPQATPTPDVPAQPEQPQAQVFDFAGRKIEVADPAVAATLKDLHKDYTALTSTYQSTNQRVKELETANQTYMNLLQQQTQAQATNAPPEQNAAPTPEDVEQIKADFMDKFYDNPLSAIEGLLDNMFQQKVQPIIEPITQERQWNDQMKELSNQHEDFPTMIGPMRQLLEDMPDLAQHGLEAVYQIAKRATPPPQPGPEQLLNDPKFVEQLMQNPDIQKQFLSKYVQEKQGSQQQAPTVMGGQPGGQAPFSPENRPTDIRTASKAFKNFLGL